VAKSRFHLFRDAVDAFDFFDARTDFADFIRADAEPVAPAQLSLAGLLSPYSPMAGMTRNDFVGVVEGRPAAAATPSPVLSSVEHHAGHTHADPTGAGGTTSAGQQVGTIAQLADYLVNGYWTQFGDIPHHWASSTITYNLGNLDPSEQSLASAALNLWSQVANIAFAQAASANINFNHNGNMRAVTNSSWNSSGQMTSATIDISSNWITTDGGYNDGRTGIYSYGFQTYSHEIGHALGLGHQGPYNGSATYGTDNIYANDTWQFSVMSYFSQDNYSGSSFDYVITPQMADLTAVQSIYGAPNTRAGNTVYGFNSNAGSIYDFTQYTGLGTPALTIYDSGGSDTLDCSGYSQSQTLNLAPGAFCSVGGYVNNIGIFTTTIIEGAIAGSGNDTIIGNSANNTIDGGPGTDTAIYSGIRSQYQVTLNQNSSFHIFDLRPGAPDGTDDVSNVEFFQFTDGTVGASNLLGLSAGGTFGPVQESGDYNGDGNSDVLWRHDSGQIYFWEMNGLQTKTEGSPTHALVTNDWHVQGGGDFNGDTKSDVLWRHDGGQVYFWEMDGLQIIGEGGVMHAPVTNDWHVQGTGDFNGDLKSDVLWRHDSGQVYFWEMNGLQIIGEGGVAHAPVPNDWHIRGTGDFDGDGKSDVLWRHDSGQVYVWEMNGLQVNTEGTIAHAAVPNDWHIQGAGDFDGDGKSDILWRHDSGQVYIWEMNGLQVKAEGTIAHAAVPNDWHIQGIGDYDADGKSDILWRHDSGQVYIWEMNGLQVKTEGGIAHAAVPNDWHIQV
jgi:serralysin